MENKNKRDINAELKADFPNEAYTVDSSRGFNLTSIKAQYINDRLNSVFGIFGWNFETETIKDDQKGILFKGTLTVTLDDKTRVVTNFGSSPHKKIASDSYKSASTDALGKCASMIGIGDKTFKGETEIVKNKKTSYVGIDKIISKRLLERKPVEDKNKPSEKQLNMLT